MFIGRRADGSIYGAWSVRQADDADHPGQEEVADDHPELKAFQSRLTPSNNGQALEQSRRDVLRKTINAQIDSLSVDQQSVMRNILKLFDREQ